MKKIISFVVIAILMTFFPFKIFQLPEEWILYVKDKVSDTIPDGEVVEPSERTNIQTGKIKMGMQKNEVNALLGNPKDKLKNEYSKYWYVYHQNYRDFILIMYTDGKVSGMYTNQDMIKLEGDIKYGSLREDVLKVYQKPLEIFEGKDYRLKMDNEESGTYLKDHHYITFFYDKHNKDKVAGIKIINQTVDLRKSELFAFPDEILKKDYETLNFDMINSERFIHGLKTLKYHDKISITAEKHAEDMAEHHYFSHTNLKKQNPFDRFERDGIQYYMAGENLAYGQVSPIEAHHGLMNSIGHRKNILKKGYEAVGIGVSFSDRNQPYYVENYITEN